MKPETEISWAESEWVSNRSNIKIEDYILVDTLRCDRKSHTSATDGIL